MNKINREMYDVKRSISHKLINNRVHQWKRIFTEVNLLIYFFYL